MKLDETPDAQLPTYLVIGLRSLYTGYTTYHPGTCYIRNSAARESTELILVIFGLLDPERLLGSLAVSTHVGSFFCGVLKVRSLLFGVYVLGPLIFWKLPDECRACVVCCPSALLEFTCKVLRAARPFQGPDQSD